MKNFNLNDLTLENIGQWPVAAKYSLMLVFALILIGVGYWLIIEPNMQEYKALHVAEAQLKAQFEQKQQESANLPAYRSQLQEINERFEDILRQLPAQNEMPGLLEDISKTGVSSGLVFELFAPMAEIKHDFYIELPINIVVIGNYRQFAVFLSRIAQLNRIVTLHDFEIIPFEDKQKKNNDLLQMKVIAKIYRYKV